MPQRLLKIFDESITSAGDRFSQIAGCDYQGEELNAAEDFRIYEDSERVPDGEQLARAMESPSHVQANVLEFTLGAFQEATKRGVSVQQLSKTTERQVHAFGALKVDNFNIGKAEDKKRTYLGYVSGLCSTFREAQLPDGRRLFAVFSTPLHDTKSHADIFVVVKAGREEKAAIQHVFWDAFNLKNLVTPS